MLTMDRPKAEQESDIDPGEGPRFRVNFVMTERERRVVEYIKDEKYRGMTALVRLHLKEVGDELGFDKD